MLHFTLTVYIINERFEFGVHITGFFIKQNVRHIKTVMSLHGYTTLYVHEDVYFQWMNQLLYLFYFCNTVTKVIC